MANEVFISYSRKDFAKVREIKDILDHELGIECWMDLDGIESGEQFKKVIITAINRYDTVLFMKTSNSMDSEFAIQELTFAKNKKKRIVLIDLDHTPMTDDFLFDYGDKDNIDWDDYLQREKLMRNLRDWFSHTLNPSKKDGRYPTFFHEGATRTTHIIFLVDCSGSMAGERMGKVNQSCSEVLRNFDIINPDIEIRVNVLMFGSYVKWMCQRVLIDDFFWEPIESGGLTSFGEACSELNQKMSKKGIFASDQRLMKSLIILMTDGEPTDEYIIRLHRLLQNPYFQESNRFAIGIGDSYNKTMLEKFAGAKKVFELPDEGENSNLQPMLERIMHMGLYAASYAALDDEEDKIMQDSGMS